MLCGDLLSSGYFMKKKRKVNILYLLTSFSIGGAEKVVARTVRKLSPAKYNITVAALKKGSGRLISELEASNVSAIDLGMRFKYDITVIWKLYSLLKRERIDLIYAYLFHPIFLSRIIGRIAKIPIILSSERVTSDAENLLRLKLNKLTCKYSDKITTVSQTVYKSYKVIGIPESKLLTIYNGIEVDRFICKAFQRRTNNSYIIGCTGRLHSKNGYKYLIEAANILRNFNLRYRFIGDGEEMIALKQQVAKMKLDNRIEFLGYRSDIPEQLTTLDIYVQPSIYEGMPNSVLEAMASGLPVIATNVGGTPEVVIDNQTGFLIPPKDPSAIAEKIMYIIEHPNLVKQIGQNARAYIEKTFSVDSMVKKTDDLFETAIREKLGLTYNDSFQRWQ